MDEVMQSYVQELLKLREKEQEIRKTKEKNNLPEKRSRIRPCGWHIMMGLPVFITVWDFLKGARRKALKSRILIFRM